jgi:hypothetical protein
MTVKRKIGSEIKSGAMSDGLKKAILENVNSNFIFLGTRFEGSTILVSSKFLVSSEK